MKNLLIIKGDTNDGDYIHRITFIDEEELKLIVKVAGLIKEEDNGKHWPTGEQSNGTEIDEMYGDKLTGEELDKFEGYVPRGEYGIHTIESIEVHRVVETNKLL